LRFCLSLANEVTAAVDAAVGSCEPRHTLSAVVEPKETRRHFSLGPPAVPANSVPPTVREHNLCVQRRQTCLYQISGSPYELPINYTWRRHCLGAQGNACQTRPQFTSIKTVLMTSEHATLHVRDIILVFPFSCQRRNEAIGHSHNEEPT